MRKGSAVRSSEFVQAEIDNGSECCVVSGVDIRRTHSEVRTMADKNDLVASNPRRSELPAVVQLDGGTAGQQGDNLLRRGLAERW